MQNLFLEYLKKTSVCFEKNVPKLLFCLTEKTRVRHVGKRSLNVCLLYTFQVQMFWTLQCISKLNWAVIKTICLTVSAF